VLDNSFGPVNSWNFVSLYLSGISPGNRGKRKYLASVARRTAEVHTQDQTFWYLINVS